MTDDETADERFARDSTMWTTYLASDEGRRRVLNFERNWHLVRAAEIDKELDRLDANRRKRRAIYAKHAPS